MANAVDFGPCASCEAKNSHATSKCRMCGEVLPWAKPPQTAQPKFANPTPSASKPGFSLNVGGSLVSVLGGIIFVAGVILWCGNVFRFYPTFPFVGYITGSIGAAIYRAGSNM